MKGIFAHTKNFLHFLSYHFCNVSVFYRFHKIIKIITPLYVIYNFMGEVLLLSSL